VKFALPAYVQETGKRVPPGNQPASARTNGWVVQAAKERQRRSHSSLRPENKHKSGNSYLGHRQQQSRLAEVHPGCISSSLRSRAAGAGSQAHFQIKRDSFVKSSRQGRVAGAVLQRHPS